MALWKPREKKKKRSRWYGSQKHKKWEIKIDKGEAESTSISTEKFVPQLQLGVYDKLIIREKNEERNRRKQVLT